MCRTILKWNDEEFENSSLKHIMKQIQIYSDIHKPENEIDDEVQEEKKNVNNYEKVETFQVLD